MSEGPVPLERLTACIKERMQKARQACPFFQLEQRAVESPAPVSVEPSQLLQQLVLPEICVSGLSAEPLKWSVEQQLQFCEALPAWIVNIESSFFKGSPDLLKQLRRQYPQRYLIARDLVMDEYQILEARMAGANAMILSNALLGPRRTQLYVGKIRFWEMEPLLEIHSLEEVRLALELKVNMVSLAPLPGHTQSWTLPNLQEASRQLRQNRLLLYGSPDLSLLSQLAPSDIQALAPGWQLWQQDDPAACLAELSANRQL